MVKVDQVTCPFCLKRVNEKEEIVSTLRKITFEDINTSTDENFQPYAILFSGSSDIKSIDFSVDGKNIAFGSKDKNISRVSS